MAERPKAPDSKSGDRVERSVGSNPTLSASFLQTGTTMSDAPGKLNLDEAMGRKPSSGAEIQPTLRIRRSDLKVLRRKPEPKKKRTMAFGVGAFAVAVILGSWRVRRRSRSWS